MELAKNQIIDIKITDMSADGNGIGRYENIAIFTPQTAIGDLVRVKILKVKKTYAYAKIEKILNASDCRISPDCEVFSKCGGCVYRHISYAAECEIKSDRVKQALIRIGKQADPKMMPIISAIDTIGYRNKAQLPISQDGTAGFYAVHSHRIIPISDCKIQPEIFNKISDVFSKWIQNNNISVYDETTHQGLIRHLYLRIAKQTNEIMVVVVTNGQKLENIDSLIKQLQILLPNTKFTLVQNINSADTNVILSDKCITLYGDGYITDILCGVQFRISPLSFYQVNRDMAEILYKKAAEYAKPENCTVLDLYCGTGTIGLSMAKSAKKIIGVEIVPEAIFDANHNAKINNITNAEFICADAAKAATKLNEQKIKPDVVIIDPPRKGCSEQLLNTIANGFNPKRLVYVSCDPATLARDIKILNDLGFSLVEATPVDLFPRTAHVETVALLCRQNTIHNMKLHASPFEMIKSGKKTIELRLFDEKRQQIKVGDIIIFTNNAGDETLKTTVKKLHCFDSFDKLYKSLPLLQCGYTQEDIDKANPTDMEQYYSVEEQNKYGVVGIEISKN